MAEDKKSFLLYADLIYTVKKLSKEQAGELFNIILEYVNDVNDGSPIINDLLIELVFEPIKQQLKRDLRRYKQKKDLWSEAGKKSAQSKALKKQSETSTESTDVENVKVHSTESTVNVNDNVNVTVNVNDNVTVNDIKESKRENLSLFEIFLTENQIQNPDALEFLNSESWFESKAMQMKSETDILIEKAKDFLVNLRHRDELEGKQLPDLRSHFINWFKIKRESVNPDKPVTYRIPKCLQQ